MGDIRKTVISLVSSGGAARVQQFRDFAEVLTYEGYLDNLLEGQDSITKLQVLMAFANGYKATGQRDKTINTFAKFGEVAEAAGLFTEQVIGFSMAAECCMTASKFKQAVVWFERATDVAANSGLVLMESNMSKGLGKAYLQSNRGEKAVQQYRHSLSLIQSVGDNDPTLSQSSFQALRGDRPFLERAALRNLVFVLGATLREEHLVEAETLLIRVLEAGDDTADSRLWNYFLHGILDASRRDYVASSKAFKAMQELAEANPEVWNDDNATDALKWARSRLEMDSGEGGAPSLSEVLDMVLQSEPGDPAVLQYEIRLDELLATCVRGQQPDLLEAFIMAHGKQGSLEEAGRLLERRVEVFGKLERFRFGIRFRFRV